MAVARIKAPPRWHRKTAEVVRDLPKARRELLRAAERRGRLAELGADEIRVLAERLPDDERVITALGDILASEERERRRPRISEIVERRRHMLVSKTQNQPKERVLLSTSTRTRRSQEDWDALAQQLLPELQAGKSVEGLRDYTGANGDAFRGALARIGYDPKGQPYTLKKISEKTPKARAKRIAKRRAEGAPWWLVMAESGESYAALVTLLGEHGYTLKGEQTSNGN